MLVQVDYTGGCTTMSVARYNPNQHIHALQCMEIWGGNAAIHDAISVPGIDVWISSEPYDGDAYGGDIHYISTCGGGRISRFVIADVSGHGALVSSVAHRLKLLMRKYINTLDQTRLAQALNHEFLQLADVGGFVTAVLTTYFAPTDHLIICNAGHPTPLWRHAATGNWEFLHHDTPHRTSTAVNLPLGVIEQTDYVQFAVKLAKGDIVLIYTDSLIESTNDNGQQLGEQGLLELIRHMEFDQPQNLNRELLTAVAAYHGKAPRDDDETLVVLHHNAADPPSPSIGQRLRIMVKMLGLVGD